MGCGAGVAVAAAAADAARLRLLPMLATMCAGRKLRAHEMIAARARVYLSRLCRSFVCAAFPTPAGLDAGGERPF